MEIKEYHKHIQKHFGEWFNEDSPVNEGAWEMVFTYSVSLLDVNYEVYAFSNPGSMRALFVQNPKDDKSEASDEECSDLKFMVTYESKEHDEKDDIYLMGRENFPDIERGSEMEFLSNLFESGVWKLKE